MTIISLNDQGLKTKAFTRRKIGQTRRMFKSEVEVAEPFYSKVFKSTSFSTSGKIS